MGPHETSDPGGEELVRPITHDQSQASLVDRVGASASGLIQKSWTRPGPHAVTNGLAAIRESTSKAESSSSAARGPALMTPEAIGVDQIQPSTGHRHGFGESFRSSRSHDRHHHQDEFDQWSMRRADEAQQSVPTDYGSANPPTECPTMREGRACMNAFSKDKDRFQHAKVEMDDGATVVSLLANPTFTVDDLPSTVWDHDPPIQASQGLQGDQILFSKDIDPTTLPNNRLKPLRVEPSNVQQRSFDRYKKGSVESALGDEWQQKPPLSLIPEFDPLENRSIDHNLNTRQWDDLRLRLSNASEGDVKPWLDILDRYQDEVWGTMLPLIEMVRDEVRSGNGSKSPEVRIAKDGPAVRRLRLVLQHLDHPQR